MSLSPPINKLTVRVGLMICDENMSLGIFRKWLEDALPTNTTDTLPGLQMEPYNVYKNEFPTSKEIGTRFDVIMVTGSPADAFGNQPWIRQLLGLLQHTYNRYRRIKLFGICFGHQLLSRALGGTVVRSPKLEYGLTHIHITHVGRTIFGMEKDFVELQQIHQDHVPLDTLSDHFSQGKIYLLGSSDRTPNQGFVKINDRCTKCEEEGHPVHQLHEHIHVMTVQGHPEFSDALATDIFRRRARHGIIRNDFVRAYLDEAGVSESSLFELGKTESKVWLENYDGVHVVGRAFWKMFGVKYAEGKEPEEEPERPEQPGEQLGGQTGDPQEPEENA